jgi:hypothetical protein
VNKWRTEIGAGAFIGSGTMLVAPVQVGAGSDHRRGLDHHARRAGGPAHARAQQAALAAGMEAPGEAVTEVRLTGDARNPSWHGPGSRALLDLLLLFRCRGWL